MNSSRTIRLLITIFVYANLNFTCKSQVATDHFEKDKLTLATKIILPNVKGRIDHLSYDSTSHLAFVAALGNNTVEAININTKQAGHSLEGLREPQGVMYIPSLKRIAVANGDNGHCDFFDATTYKQLAAIDLKKDADNIRYDASTNLLYVGYGDGAIAVMDAKSMKQVGEIQLDGHPEAFQISKKHNRLYINVPDADEIEVADLSTNKIIDKWKNTNASSNFPMALDEKNDRLFIGYRSPAKLKMINSETGKEITVNNCSGDADDVFYDPADSLVFVSAGKGFIDVFRATDKELTQINHIKTSNGARTSLLLATEKKFLLAIPAHGGNPAALWVFIE